MREIIQTPDAPQAVGPYSQAVRVGDLLFVSGQIPLDPSSGQLVSGTIRNQTQRVMDNITAILGAAGGSLTSICKTTIFLTDLSNFGDVNSCYADYFPSDPPARSTIQVAALPLGAEIEIEVIAHLPAGD